jgi:hypothetical protein
MIIAQRIRTCIDRPRTHKIVTNTVRPSSPVTTTCCLTNRWQESMRKHMIIIEPSRASRIHEFGPQTATQKAHRSEAVAEP